MGDRERERDERLARKAFWEASDFWENDGNAESPEAFKATVERIVKILVEARHEALADARREAEAERDAARAELERVRGERDALIAAWPEGHDRRCVYRTPYDVWCVAGGCGGRDPFRQRSDAVRAAVGLAPAEGAELTLAERNAVVAGVAGAVRAAAGIGGESQTHDPV